jgi:hypothetical protein
MLQLWLKRQILNLQTLYQEAEGRLTEIVKAASLAAVNKLLMGEDS